jgi:hypothetical protein
MTNKNVENGIFIAISADGKYLCFYTEFRCIYPKFKLNTALLKKL